MVLEAIAGATAGMYIYHHVKGAVEAVHEYKEAKKETARKLIELEEAKKTIERFEEWNAQIEQEKEDAVRDMRFYRNLCKKADLLIDPEDSIEEFSRKMEKDNTVIVFD